MRNQNEIELVNLKPMSFISSRSGRTESIKYPDIYSNENNGTETEALRRRGRDNPYFTLKNIIRKQGVVSEISPEIFTNEDAIRMEAKPIKKKIDFINQHFEGNRPAFFNKVKFTEKKSSRFTKSKITWINAFLRKLEAQYGTDLYLQYKYMVYLLYMNAAIFLINLAIVIIPFYLSIFHVFNFSYIPSHVCYDNGTDSVKDPLHVLQAAMSIQGLFYGTYNIEKIGGRYNFQAAYAFAIIMCVLFTLFFLMYRSSLINTRTFRLDESFYCTNSIFGGIRLHLTDTKLSKINFEKISFDLKVFADYMSETAKNKGLKKVFTILSRFLVTLFVLCYYLLTFFIIYYTVKYVDDSIIIGNFQFIKAFLSSAVLSGIRIIFHFSILFLIEFENYSPNVKLFILMLRNFVEEIILLSAYLRKYFMEGGGMACWESHYALDLFLYVTVEIFCSIPIHLFGLLISYIGSYIRIKKLSYVVSPVLLQVFLDQTVTNIGNPFCPWLPLVTAFKLLCNMLIIPKLLSYCYKMESSFYNTYILKSFCDICVWLSNIVYIITLGYTITSRKVSKCGPFRPTSCNDTSNFSERIIQIISQTINIDNPLIRYLRSYCFYFLIFTILCALISELINRCKFYKISKEMHERYFKYLIMVNEDNENKLRDVREKYAQT